MISSQPLTLRSSVRLKQRCAAPLKPRVGRGASGAGSLGAFRCASEHSTAPIAVKCQSFLDNVMLSSGAFEHGMIEAGDQRQGGAECSHILHRD